MDDHQDCNFYIEILAGDRRGERIEIPRFDPMASAAPCAWIREDEAICFELVSPCGTESPVLWISDLPKPPSNSKIIRKQMHYFWHPESRGVNQYQAFFLNCFGSCQLDIEIQNKGGGQQWIELAPFEVRAKKITAERLRKIIQYLAAHMDDLTDSVFSVTQVAVGQRGRKVSTFLKAVEEGLHLFEQQLPILLTRYCTRLVPKRVVRMPGANDYFEANTAEWLLSHLDTLMPAADLDNAVATIDGHPYTASKLEVSELVEDSDVYENQVLHSYLNSIKTFLVETRKECDRIQSQASPAGTEEPAESVPYKGDASRYVSFSIEIKTSVRELFKARRTKCDQLLEKSNYLRRVLEEKVPVTRLFAGVPALTPWIKANLHYRILFEKIIRWYQMGRADWSNEEALVGVRSIDELYEYFCLYKLIDGLEKLGFSRKDRSEAESQDSIYLDSVPKQTYEFEKGRIHLTLYYEKEIWSPKYKTSEESHYLNVEGWIWDTYRRKGKRTRFNSKRVPDYIFEILVDQGTSAPDRESDRVLAVFDAKYSPADMVFFEKLPLLVMRYVHGISGRAGGISPVLSLYLFHPKDVSQDSKLPPVRSFYTNDYDIFGEKAAIPALGAAEVDPASDWDISDLIQRIIELAEQRLAPSPNSP